LEEQSVHSNEDAKEENKEQPQIDDLYNLIFIEISYSWVLFTNRFKCLLIGFTDHSIFLLQLFLYGIGFYMVFVFELF
jgi:hypothetical protein